MTKTVLFLENAITVLLALIPFSMAIAHAPMNVFMGLLIFCFLLKRILAGQNVFFKSPAILPLALFFILTCLSLLYTINSRDTFKGGFLRLLSYVFVFIACAQEVNSRRRIRIIVYGIFAGLLLTCVNELWQVYSGRDFIRGYATIINIGLVRATSSFSDANILGVYLSALAPVVLGLALYYYKGAKKLVFMVLGLLAVTGAALTYSRPTLLAVYVALVYMGIVRKDKKLIAVLLIFTLLSPFLAPRQVKQWAKDVEYNPIRFMCNDDRITIYLHSMQMIKDRPVLGSGANTFMKNFANYHKPPHYRGVPAIDYIYAHSIYVQLAGELGLLGLGLFAWFAAALFLSAARIYRGLKDRYSRVMLMSISAGVLAFLVNGLTESSLSSARVALIFWYMAGLVLAMRNLSEAPAGQ